MPIRAYRFSTFTLDVENARLLREGARQTLSPKDFGLLHHLVAHRGRVIPHAELLEVVWRGIKVGSDALKVRVYRLRQILGDDASSPRFIESAHGDGYRFVAPVVSSPDDAELSQSPISPRSPLVGRDAELARLQELLARAAAGQRQIVFVTGEPGIGKTALLDELVARAAGAWIGRGECIEHYGSGEPYLPVMAALSRLARTDAHEQLAAVLREVAPSWLLELPALLASQERATHRPQEFAPSRERILRELAEALEVLTTRRAVGNEPPLLLLALEDLHWTDPSTIELLAMLARRSDRARLLVVGSYRPADATAPNHPLGPMLAELRVHSAISEIALGPISERDVAHYLDARFPANAFSSEIAPLLHQRTGGNPLFLKDVVRDWVALQLVVRGNGEWKFRGDAQTIHGAVPASLRHLVEKQRSALHPAERRLLEAASVAGLEFSAAAVAAALTQGSADLEEQALRLVERERLRIAGVEDWPDGTRTTRFAFLHALHRELWYERIPASRRREWHLRVAERKEAAYGARSHEVAAELALHFEEGGDPRRAISYLEHASGHAFRRAANSEARAHLSRAFGLLRELADTPERLRQELELQLRLGTLLAMTEGYASLGTARAFQRAHEVSAQLGDATALFDAVGGLLLSFLVRGDTTVALDLAGQLLRIAEASGDPIHRMAAHTILGQVLCARGVLADAVVHAKLGLELSRSHWDDSLVPIYGLHLGVCCSGVAAMAMQLLGDSDQALEYFNETLGFQSAEAHFIVSAGVLSVGLNFLQIRGDAAWALELAEAAANRGSAEGPWNVFQMRSEVLHGWASSIQGTPAPGVGRVLSGTQALRAAGDLIFEPYFLGLLADGYRRLGQSAEARAALVEAFAAANRDGPGWYDAELHRIDGELLRESGAELEAEKCFQQALAVARQQEAKAWELRAAVSLGELWRRQGRIDDARNLVSQTYGSFTQGFDTPDLKRACAFLEELP